MDLVLLDQLDHVDLMAEEEHQDYQVAPEDLEQLDLQGLKDSQDLQARLVDQDNPVLLDLQEVLAGLELEDNLVNKVHQAHRVLQGTEDQRANVDLLEKVVRLDQQVITLFSSVFCISNCTCSTERLFQLCKLKMKLKLK